MTDDIIETIETKNYLHIDNGGVAFFIKTDIIGEPDRPEDQFSNTTLDVETSYFGYPFIRCFITLNGTEHLKSIIETLTEHYHKLKANGTKEN